jgi:hypothetical protein
MHANELSLGNWIYGGNEEGHKFPERVTVERLGWMGNAYPVHLTPQLLEKAGFKKHDSVWVKTYHKGFVAFELHEHYDEDAKMYFYDYPVKPAFKRRVYDLHHLQNLFYNLTGEVIDIEL